MAGQSRLNVRKRNSQLVKSSRQFFGMRTVKFTLRINYVEKGKLLTATYVEIMMRLNEEEEFYK